MDRREHFLKVVEEEGSEVAHRVSKALRFGLSEVQPEQSMTNAERIQDEVYDLIGAYEAARHEGNNLPPLDLSPEAVKFYGRWKHAKIVRFLEISREQGTLTEAPAKQVQP